MKVIEASVSYSKCSQRLYNTTMKPSVAAEKGGDIRYDETASLLVKISYYLGNEKNVSDSFYDLQSMQNR